MDDLPGPKRGVSPALFFRDEIVWSNSHTHFALAYTITEASMNNEIGCVMWASSDGKVSAILGNPKRVYACCWFSPWCIWLNDETFLFKVQHYDGEKLHLPLVAIHVGQGFAVFPGTNNAESRPNAKISFEGKFEPLLGKKLLNAVRDSQ